MLQKHRRMVTSGLLFHISGSNLALIKVIDKQGRCCHSMFSFMLNNFDVMMLLIVVLYRRG